MIQGGDPQSKNSDPGAFLGGGDVGYTIPAEFDTSLFHKFGALAAARTNNPEKASSGCQFYIVQNKNGLARLDGDYTIYGQVFKGMDVVDAIVSVQTDSTDAPLSPIKLDVNVIKLSKEELKKKGWPLK